MTLNMLNFPIVRDRFPCPTSYCANEGKMFKNFIILKESTLLDVMQIKFYDLFKRDFDILRILNLPIRA